MISIRALKATVFEFQRDDALGLAAQLAFYLILALFPFILVLVSLMGTFSNEDLANTVLQYFESVTPPEVYQLISSYLGSVLSGKNQAPGLFSIGIVLTL